MLKPTGKDQEHAARIVPRSRTWEELSVPGSVADGGESKPAEGGADTPDRMVRDGGAPSSQLPPLCHHRSHTTCNYVPNAETKFISKEKHTNQAMTVEEQMKTRRPTCSCSL